MSLKDLFYTGISFEVFLENCEEEYKEKINTIIENIAIPDDIKNKIKDLERKIYIMAFAHDWCPDCQINLSAIYSMNSINNNIKLKILQRDGNEKFLEKYKICGKPRIPTFIIMNENFEEMGFFIEVPSIVREIICRGNETEILVCKRKYKKGEYIKDTILDFLKIIA